MERWRDRYYKRTKERKVQVGGKETGRFSSEGRKEGGREGGSELTNIR